MTYPVINEICMMEDWAHKVGGVIHVPGRGDMIVNQIVPRIDGYEIEIRREADNWTGIYCFIPAMTITAIFYKIPEVGETND